MLTDPVGQRAREVIAYIKETGTTGLSLLLVSFYLGQTAGLIPDVVRDDHKDIVTVVAKMREEQKIIEDKREKERDESKRFMIEQAVMAKDNSESIKAVARTMCLLIPNISKREQNECMKGVR